MEIPVGFIQQSLEIAERKAKDGCEFVLSFDGKLIAPGCKGDSKGDANLWGLEGPPTLSQSLKVLKNTLSNAQKINVDMRHTDTSLHFTHLRELLNVSSRRIKRLRGRITGCFYLRKKLVEKCKDSEELQYKHRRKMSSLNENTSECETVVRSLLEINVLCTKIMAILNSNHDVHIGSNVWHIIFTEHANNFQLLPPEVVQLFMDLDDEDNVQFVKQRSKKWFEIRSKARITGSTMYAALGLDTLAKQKEHHYIHVRGRKPPPTPPDLQKLFDHGTKNEVNAIATLISTVVPAYLPACFAFYEVGPAFIHSQGRKYLMEISADGILQCSDGTDTCPNFHLHSDRKIMVEVKSPVPKENIAETIFYDVPTRYMLQLQVEMKAYSCNELWFVCSMAVSETVTVVRYDDNLWNKAWDVLVNLYDKEKPNIPTKLHPSIKNLRLAISQSKEQCCKFLCEVPTITGEYENITLSPNFASPYSPCPVRQMQHFTPQEVSNFNQHLYSLSTSAFKQCHEVLCDPGKELIVFMLTDKDRKQDKNIPYSYPIAYAMKGSSMTNSHLQKMVHMIRNELHTRKIPILCETYDGQWHKHVTENAQSHRLTQLFGRDNWNRVASLTKDKCIEQVSTMCVVKNSTHIVLMEKEITGEEELIVGNFKMEKGSRNELHVSTKEGRMRYVHSVHPLSRPDLYSKTQVDLSYNNDNEYLVCENKYEREATGEKVKKLRKYKFTSVFTSAETY